MANKRSLKKRLNNVASELFAECVAAYLEVQDEDITQLDDILTAILKTHREYVERVSSPEPGMSKKLYYQILWKDFNKHVEEIRYNIKALS